MTKTLHNGIAWHNRTPEYRKAALERANNAALMSNYGRGLTNKAFAAQDKAFNDKCVLADVKPTKRQAAKYRRGIGSAYKVKEV